MARFDDLLYVGRPVVGKLAGDRLADEPALCFGSFLHATWPCKNSVRRGVTDEEVGTLGDRQEQPGEQPVR